MSIFVSIIIMQHNQILYIAFFIITYFLISIIGILHTHAKELRRSGSQSITKKVLWFIPGVNVIMFVLVLLKSGLRNF